MLGNRYIGLNPLETLAQDFRIRDEREGENDGRQRTFAKGLFEGLDVGLGGEGCSRRTENLINALDLAFGDALQYNTGASYPDFCQKARHVLIGLGKLGIRGDKIYEFFEEAVSRSVFEMLHPGVPVQFIEMMFMTDDSPSERLRRISGEEARKTLDRNAKRENLAQHEAMRELDIGGCARMLMDEAEAALGPLIAAWSCSRTRESLIGRACSGNECMGGCDMGMLIRVSHDLLCKEEGRKGVLLLRKAF